MDRLTGVRRSYDWGSRSALPDLLGVAADGQPWAEQWFGTHPSGPAQLSDGRSLDQVVAHDPIAALGATGSTDLPFLVKFLAADAPLSLQVHPSMAQAREGFAAEEARGVPLDAPERSFRDPSHKPEMIVALTPFEALCGFRDPSATHQLLTDLGADELDPVVQQLADTSSADALRSVMEFLLTLEPERGAELADALVRAFRACADPQWSAERSLILRLSQQYPGDPGVVIAGLLNFVRLDPGQALFLDAGNLHAYVSGVGLEIMANSDNVIRGGLTSKHVDAQVLLDILDPSPLSPDVQTPVSVDGRAPFVVPVSDFSVTRFDLEPGRTLAGLPGPAIGVCVGGRVDLGDLAMVRGDAIWQAAVDEPVPVSGMGTLYWVTVGSN